MAINRGVAEARKRVVRAQARQRPRGPLVVANDLAEWITRHAIVPSTGAGPTLPIGRARKGSRLAAATSPPPVVVRNSPIASGLVRNLVTYPLLGPAAMYEVGAAGFEAAQGDNARAGRLAKGLTEGAIGLAAQGRWAEAAKYAEANPLFALQELRGGKAIVGRGAGATARAIPGPTRRAASTARADRDLGVGRATERQRYSPDVLTKAVQVLGERIAGDRPRNVEARLRKRADFLSDSANAATQAGRAQELQAAGRARPTRSGNRVGRAVERRLPTGRGAGRVAPSRVTRPERDVVPLVMQRVVRSERTFETDLRRELARLDAEYKNRKQFRSGEQASANRRQAQSIARVLKDPKAIANAKRAVGAADELARRTNAIEARAIAARALDPDAAARAKLFPYAQTHMGARYGGATRVEGKKAVSVAARDLERARGARDHVLAGLESNATKKPRTTKEYKRAQARVKTAQDALTSARAQRRAGGKALRGQDGKVITNEQIIEHMRRSGVPFDGDQPLVTYLPHRPDVRGARAYYQTAFAGRRDLDGSKARTGEALRKGTHESSYDLPTEHLLRLRGVTERIAQHDALIRDQGLRRPDRKLFTWQEAKDHAENALKDSHGERIPGRAELVPYRVAPGKYDQSRMKDILERQDPEASPDLSRLMEADFARRLEAPHPADKTARNVVLLPRATVERLKDQMQTASPAGRAGNVASSLFRTTVLPFSVKWVVGNVAEALLRLGAVGAGPNAHRIGRRVLSEMHKQDAEQAAQVKAALTGGLYFGQRGLTVTRKADQFEGGALARPAKAIATAGRAPVVKQIVGGIHAYTDAVFNLNRFLEQQAQVTALGKWSKREMQEFTGSWAKAVRAQETVAAEVARGLLETKNQLDAARYLDETLGKYSRFSPGMRRAIQSYAPFLPWYVNAVRWVGWTLPAKHPVKTALLTRVEDTIQADFDAQHQDLPPGSLRAAIPHDGGYVDIARYSPFGAWVAPLGGDLETLSAPLLPQISGFVAATKGQNFTGRKAQVEGLAYADDVPSQVRAAMALNALAEAFIPGVQIARRIQEGGASPYDNSTVLSPKTKPGTDVETAANRILNPIRPVRLTGKERATRKPGLPQVDWKRAAAGGAGSMPQIDWAKAAGR